MRKSGILMHISSLPSDYGIGTMGKEAYKFVDFLKSAKQKCWQILPIGPTSYGDSPYQSFSTNAGNPYFIDMDILREEGLLKKSDYSKLDWGKDRKNVDYETIYENRFKVLKIAFEEFKKGDLSEFYDFLQKNERWISNYALFMSIKNENDGKSWLEWEDGLNVILIRYGNLSRRTKMTLCFGSLCSLNSLNSGTNLKSMPMTTVCQ